MKLPGEFIDEMLAAREKDLIGKLALSKDSEADIVKGRLFEVQDLRGALKRGWQRYQAKQ